LNFKFLSLISIWNLKVSRTRNLEIYASFTSSNPVPKFSSFSGFTTSQPHTWKLEIIRLFSSSNPGFLEISRPVFPSVIHLVISWPGYPVSYESYNRFPLSRSPFSNVSTLGSLFASPYIWVVKNVRNPFDRLNYYRIPATFVVYLRIRLELRVPTRELSSVPDTDFRNCGLFMNPCTEKLIFQQSTDFLTFWCVLWWW